MGVAVKKHLYIIHGWTYSIEPWTSTVSVLRSWGYEVTQLRVPGLTAASEAVWTIDDYVAWLADELSGETAPIVLGHSNGGRIAMNYLAKEKGRFGQLLLLSSAGVEIRAERLSRKRTLLKQAAKVLRPLRSVPLVRKIVYHLLGSDYNQAPPNMKQTLANMLASDKDLNAANVRVPTTILWGENDRVTPPSMAQKLHHLIKDSKLRLFPHWGHAPYLTHPYELAKAIQAALEEKV